MSLSVPGYDVEKLLGRGAYSEVWLGRARRSGVRVALKRVEITAASADRAARAEAALLAALEHPSLIRFEQFISCKDFAVLVLELAAGGSLAELLARRERLSIDEAGVTMSDIGSALAHAHSEGVLHGDMSAANVLYTSEGRPKLADLGLARMLGTDAAWIGTPAYIDPVVAAGGAFGAASDVFGLAAVALHAFTGAGPWSAGGPAAEDVLAHAAEQREVPDLQARLRELPDNIAMALSRALDPLPARRGTAAEFALDLRAAVSPTPVVLRAGRVLTPGRHYADRMEADRMDADRMDADRIGAGCDEADRMEADGQPGPAGLGTGRPEAMDRPDFRRPADLTHISRPQVRQLLVTTPSSRERMQTWLRKRRILIGSGVLVVAAVGALGIAGPSMAGALTHRAGTQPPTAPVAVSSHPTAAATATSAAATPKATTSAHSTPKVVPLNARPTAAAAPKATTTSAADELDVTWTALNAIDERRSSAYQRRTPAVLAAVYSSRTLLAQDSAQLLATTPAGCHIDGLHVTYGNISIETFAESKIALSADVASSSARLVCANALRGTAVAIRPVRMSLVLVRSGQSGFQIASQRPVSS